MSLKKSDTIRVPGACLYYQTQGSGPLLLILQGGDGDADGSMSLADHLVEHYTVVTYDRRGLSRSKLDEPFEALRLETHSNDAHLLLATLTTEPALVFGASMGALIGLDLVARHPEQIRMFVAHEALRWNHCPTPSERAPCKIRKRWTKYIVVKVWRRL
jgi:pimeloyl-ACP methyl ester carboxylesterase